MSSSDEEFLDASPVAVEPVTRRGNRRKANTPSPKKVPRKKQREVLADFNEVEDSDEEEEEAHGSRGGRRNPRGVHQVKRKRTEVSSADSALEEDDDRRGSTSSEMENRPPVASTDIVSALADEIPEDSSQPVNNGEAPGRTRKRLSIRADNGSDRRSSVSTASAVESAVGTNEVQTIYETCCQMFNSNRINPQNAFNLRLLDCINQMINSPGYDKSNMQLTSSTVEIGTKIYVCRVDNTHSQVLSLASDISLQQRRKKKDGASAEGEQHDENEAGRAEGGEDGFDDDEANARRQRQKRKAIKKRGKFVETDNAKLLTGLEEQNVKFVTRRSCLKKKFNEMINDDFEFDYFSYFLEPEDVHPLQTDAENERMKNNLRISDEYISSTVMGQVDFLPFSYLPTFDPENYNVWGRPLNEAEDLRHQFSQEPQLPVNDEFAYDPANRPAEYPDEGGPDHAMNDTFGEALPNFGDVDEAAGEGGLAAVSFHDIRSLDHLDDYFQKVRNLLKVSKSKYGWCGPNFVRPKTTWPTQRGARTARVKKVPERFDFTKVDWTDKANKFNPSQPAKTIYDDKIIESWSTKKTNIPFLGIEITSYDDDFDPLDFQNENDPKYVPTIFKLFTSRNRSILDLLKIAERKRHSSGASFQPPHIGDDDGFDHDNDIELPRDIAEDFCSQPMNEEGYHPPDGATPAEAPWQFPSSVPGLLNDDPLSLVSGVDSIRFSKKPKPIDMGGLKRAILKTLMTNLKLDTETAQPLEEEETKVDLAQLIFQVLKKLDSRTEKLLSVPIFIVALMHVVADKRLFVVYDDSDPNCPVVIARGKNFNHADHIPMPVGGFDE